MNSKCVIVKVLLSSMPSSVDFLETSLRRIDVGRPLNHPVFPVFVYGIEH